MLNTDTSSRRWLLLGAVLAGGCLLLLGTRVRGIALNTLWLSLAVTCLAVPLGVAIAAVLAKTNAPGARWATATFAVLLFVPLYLHAAGWQAALGVGGWMLADGGHQLVQPWLDGWRGAIVVHTMAAVPWVVCIVVAGLRRVPAASEEAALLSSSPGAVLWSVTFPAAAPAIGVAALWTMVSVASEMTVTDFFQIRTFAEEVYTAAAAGGFQTNNPAADYAPWLALHKNLGLLAGIGLLAVLSGMVLLVVYRQMLTPAASELRPPWRWRLARGKWLAAIVPWGAIACLAGLPVVSLVYKAGLGAEQTAAGWRRVWTVDKLGSELTAAPGLHVRETWQTIALGILVATTATVFGILLAWRLRTARRLPFVTLAGFAMALSVPGPLLGLAVIRLLNHPYDSLLAPLTTAYDQTLLAPWLVQCVRLVPVAALIVAAGFARVPDETLEAARLDGARWWRQCLQVALPIGLPMVVAAWLVTFALSSGELAATVLVMPPGPPTLTIRLFSLLHYGVEDQVAAISLVYLAALTTVAMVAVWLAGRFRRGAT